MVNFGDCDVHTMAWSMDWGLEWWLSHKVMGGTAIVQSMNSDISIAHHASWMFFQLYVYIDVDMCINMYVCMDIFIEIA